MARSIIPRWMSRFLLAEGGESCYNDLKPRAIAGLFASEFQFYCQKNLAFFNISV